MPVIFHLQLASFFPFLDYILSAWLQWTKYSVQNSECFKSLSSVFLFYVAHTSAVVGCPLFFWASNGFIKWVFFNPAQWVMALNGEFSSKFLAQSESLKKIWFPQSWQCLLFSPLFHLKLSFIFLTVFQVSYCFFITLSFLTIFM